MPCCFGYCILSILNLLDCLLLKLVYNKIYKVLKICTVLLLKFHLILCGLKGTMQQSEPQAQPMDTSTAYNIVVPQLVLMQINIMGHRAMLKNNKRLWLIICTLENH